MRIRYLSLIALLAGAASLPAQTQADFFDGSVLHYLRFEMNPSDWQRLRATFTTNNYYNCNMRWRGLTAENIGMRSRGLGSRSGDKPGLRVDFDRFETDQEFLGLKSFVLDNLVQDASMLRERLTMLLFERLRVPASREAHCRMYVNNEYIGVYAIAESVDKKFLARTLGESDGYLYEYQWTEPYYFEYRGSDPARYSPSPFKPETHENDPNPRPLEALVRTVNQAPDADFVRAAGEYLNLRLTMQHAAIENFVAETDGILGGFGMNNFYFYRFERKNLHQFLVWDKDNTFGGLLPTERERIEYPILKGVSENVLARRAMAVPDLRNAYLDTLFRATQSAGGPGGWLEQEIDREYNLIRQSALEDPNKRCPDAGGGHVPCTNTQFEAAIALLKRFARGRSEYVLRELQNNGYVIAGAPRLAEGGAVNAATFATTLSPGSLISLFGERLASGTAVASSLPLPTDLGGVSVLLNGVRAPLLFVSPDQVNLQIPWEIQAGDVSISILSGGVPGNTLEAALGAQSPGVFAVVHASDGALVSADRPAGSGSVLVIYANGLGPVTPATTTGQAAAADPLSRTQATPNVTVGGIPAELLFSGLTPGYVGLYQLNVRLGTGVPAGLETPLVVSVSVVTGPPVNMSTR